MIRPFGIDLVSYLWSVFLFISVSEYKSPLSVCLIHPNLVSLHFYFDLWIIVRDACTVINYCCYIISNSYAFSLVNVGTTNAWLHCEWVGHLNTQDTPLPLTAMSITGSYQIHASSCISVWNTNWQYDAIALVRCFLSSSGTNFLSSSKQYVLSDSSRF